MQITPGVTHSDDRMISLCESIAHVVFNQISLVIIGMLFYPHVFIEDVGHLDLAFAFGSVGIAPSLGSSMGVGRLSFRWFGPWGTIRFLTHYPV